MKVRLAALTALAIVAVVPAAYSAAGSTAQTQPASGFAGPVTTPPRALDTDLGSSTGALHRIRCATALPGTRCWVSR